MNEEIQLIEVKSVCCVPVWMGKGGKTGIKILWFGEVDAYMQGSKGTSLIIMEG